MGFSTCAGASGGDPEHQAHRLPRAHANAGHDTRRIQDWLGHRWIQHTTRYTQLSAAPYVPSIDRQKS
jgi:site-specific recombinase XerD